MTHIEKYHADESNDGSNDEERTIAWCGQSAILHPDGTVDPKGFDFYHEQAGYKSDCLPCLQGLLRKCLS